MDKRIDIIHGDCLDVMKNIEAETIDLIATDPPYNLSKNYGNNSDKQSPNEYIDFSRQWLTEAKRILKPTGTIYLFMGVRYIAYIYMILEQELNLEFNSWISWCYTQGIGKIKGFSPRHDDILMFTKTSDFKFNLDDVRIPQKYYRRINNMRGANPGNVWDFSHIHYLFQFLCRFFLFADKLVKKYLNHKTGLILYHLHRLTQVSFFQKELLVFG